MTKPLVPRNWMLNVKRLEKGSFIRKKCNPGQLAADRPTLAQQGKRRSRITLAPAPWK